MNCRIYLNELRRKINAKPKEKIDKRYKPYLAPNNKYYEAHCGYCAEADYLIEIYKIKK